MAPGFAELLTLRRKSRITGWFQLGWRIAAVVALIGILILFRHRMSLGGVNLLALYLQEHHGMRAGYVQMASDALILLASIFVLGLDKLALSLLGTGVLNLVLAMNHRPGRYTGMS